MIHLDKDALECDLAETYHIYNMYELPLKKVALFSYGLRNNSRIKMKMNEMDYPFETIMIAGILDKVSLLLWSMAGDSQNSSKPESILNKLLGVSEQLNGKDHLLFESGTEFDQMWKLLTNKEEEL